MFWLELLQKPKKAFIGNSLSLAEQVENQFRDRVGRKSRGVKQGPFYVLWTPSMPSVLIELGFLSNSTEEQFLASKQGQEYMASAIYRAIKDYKTQIESDWQSVKCDKDLALFPSEKGFFITWGQNHFSKRRVW